MNFSRPTTHLRAAFGMAPVCLRAGWHSRSRRETGMAAGIRGIAIAVAILQ